MSKIKKALEYIEYMIQELPGGIDYDADEDNPSPHDMSAHIGGLIWQMCNEALEDLTNTEEYTNAQ